MNLKLSVIIPTCDRNDLLKLCMERLKPGVQILDPSQYEVWVTDDGKKSTARNLIAEEFPWAQWVDGPKRGPAANRNNGAKYARGTWLVFVDDDCIPDFGLLYNYTLAIESYKQILVFEGRICANREQLRLDEESPINETGGYLWSCNFCIRKDVFSELNGFDEGFVYAAMEDVDFEKRLSLNKIEVMFTREASVMHPWRRISGMDIFNKRLHAHKYYYRKYPEERIKTGIRYIISSLKNMFLASIPFILKGKFNGISILLYRTIFIFRLYFNSKFVS